MGNMRFKVGDRVRIKSLDWYNENKNKVGNILYKRDGSVYPVFFSKYMSNFCGEILTIKSVFKHSYHMNETSSCEFWTDEMIEGLAEESDDFEKMYMESEKRYEEEYSKGEYCHEQSFKWGFQEGYDYAHENEKLEINLKNGYEFRDDSGNVINTQKIIMGKKKKEYPKTYVECCELLSLGEDGRLYTKGYKASLIQDFQKLLICRDAY